MACGYMHHTSLSQSHVHEPLNTIHMEINSPIVLHCTYMLYGNRASVLERLTCITMLDDGRQPYGSWELSKL